MGEADKLSDIQLAHEVSKLMYAPTSRKIAPLIWAIERLVMPPEVGAYTDKMAFQFLLTALQEAQKKHSTKEDEPE